MRVATPPITDRHEMRVCGSAALLTRELAGLVPAAQIKGGDTKVMWDPRNSDEVESARRTFEELRAKGFTAFQVQPDGGKGVQVTDFDAAAAKYILIPRMVGG